MQLSFDGNVLVKLDFQTKAPNQPSDHDQYMLLPVPDEKILCNDMLLQSINATSMIWYFTIKAYHIRLCLGVK